MEVVEQCFGKLLRAIPATVSVFIGLDEIQNHLQKEKLFKFLQNVYAKPLPGSGLTHNLNFTKKHLGVLGVCALTGTVARTLKQTLHLHTTVRCAKASAQLQEEAKADAGATGEAEKDVLRQKLYSDIQRYISFAHGSDVADADPKAPRLTLVRITTLCAVLHHFLPDAQQSSLIRIPVFVSCASTTSFARGWPPRAHGPVLQQKDSPAAREKVGITR